MRAKIYSAFCENFQFHLLVEISPDRIATFENLVTQMTFKAVESEPPVSHRFNALDRSILKEGRSLSFSEITLGMVDQPPPDMSIAINPRTSIHRFRILANSRPVWAGRRSLFVQPPPTKGFFRNPMKNARA